MSFTELAQNRYSVRKFSDKQVEQEKIDEIIKSAILSPTATNSQPFKVWVLKSDDAVKKVANATSCTFGAKLFFVIGADKNSGWVRPFDNKRFAEIDASIVATHVMLQIHDIGLGTTWVGYFEEDKLKSEFPEMEEYDIVSIFPVGYPSDDAEPAPKHSQSKPQTELIQIL
jgi:nitroreductase